MTVRIMPIASARGARWLDSVREIADVRGAGDAVSRRSGGEPRASERSLLSDNRVNPRRRTALDHNSGVFRSTCLPRALTHSTLWLSFRRSSPLEGNHYEKSPAVVRSRHSSRCLRSTRTVDHLRKRSVGCDFRIFRFSSGNSAIVRHAHRRHSRFPRTNETRRPPRLRTPAFSWLWALLQQHPAHPRRGQEAGLQRRWLQGEDWLRMAQQCREKHLLATL